jgi:hypothetical protein
VRRGVGTPDFLIRSFRADVRIVGDLGTSSGKLGVIGTGAQQFADRPVDSSPRLPRPPFSFNRCFKVLEAVKQPATFPKRLRHHAGYYGEQALEMPVLRLRGLPTWRFAMRRAQEAFNVADI